MLVLADHVAVVVQIELRVVDGGEKVPEVRCDEEQNGGDQHANGRGQVNKP